MTTLLDIPLDQLHPRPDNVRANVDGSDLVPSIEAHGILQPLNVTERIEGGYWINAGHRRHHGATLAEGCETAPCLVDDLDNTADITEAMLIENLMRTDLNPIEEARGYRVLVDAGRNQKQVAEAIGVSQSVVSRRLKLLELPEVGLERISAGELSLEDAEQLLKVPADQRAEAIEKNWSRWQIEDAARRVERAERDAAEAKEAEAFTAELAEFAALRDLPIIDNDEIRPHMWKVVPVDGDPTRAYELLVDDNGDYVQLTIDDLEHWEIPDNVVGLQAASKHDWNTEITTYFARPVITVPAPEDLVDEDGNVRDHDQLQKARNAAAAKDRQEREAHFNAWAESVTGAAPKAADVGKLAVLTIIYELVDLIGELDEYMPKDLLPDGFDDLGWDAKSEACQQILTEMSEVDRLRVVVRFAIGSFKSEAMYGREMNPRQQAIADALGYQPLVECTEPDAEAA